MAQSYRRAPFSPPAALLQLDRVTEHLISLSPFQTTRRHNVDAHSQQPLQLCPKNCEVEQRCARPNVDEEIDIAPSVGLTTGQRTKHAWMGCAVGLHDAHDLLPAPQDVVEVDLLTHGAHFRFPMVSMTSLGAM